MQKGQAMIEYVICYASIMAIVMIAVPNINFEVVFDKSVNMVKEVRK